MDQDFDLSKIPEVQDIGDCNPMETLRALNPADEKNIAPNNDHQPTTYAGDRSKHEGGNGQEDTILVDKRGQKSGGDSNEDFCSSSSAESPSDDIEERESDSAEPAAGFLALSRSKDQSVKSPLEIAREKLNAVLNEQIKQVAQIKEQLPQEDDVEIDLRDEAERLKEDFPHLYRRVQFTHKRIVSLEAYNELLLRKIEDLAQIIRDFTTSVLTIFDQLVERQEQAYNQLL